jgi:C-terminal processing protease CtpA/Prc
MRIVRLCTIVVLFVLLCASNSCAPIFAQQPQQQQKLNSTDLERAHLMLRQAYDEVMKNYYDPKYHGVDLDTSFHQYDTRLNSAQSINETFRIIAAFLTTLHDSHTYFMPPARTNRSSIAFHMEMVGDKGFITRIRPGTDAATKLHIGDQVLALNGFNVKRADFSSMQYFFQVLSPAPTEHLKLANPAGEQRDEIVRAALRPGKAILDVAGGGAGGDFWELVREDEEDAHHNRERIFEAGETVIWKMPSFYVEQSTIDSLFSKVRKHKTLILDLRDDPGGSIDTLKDMLGHIFDHEIKMADRVSRKDLKPEMVKARGPVFSGKLIVLVDNNSASASELFARVVQLEHRGTVLGDRSAGAVMEARHFNESLGADTKIFYGYSITSADLLMTDGKSLENIGVTPDELILPTAADLAGGRDPVLSRAAELAGTNLDPDAAGKLFPFEWPPI